MYDVLKVSRVRLLQILKNQRQVPRKIEDAKLVNDALKSAIAQRRPKPGLIHHSDHGAQYRSILFGKTLEHAGILPSMVAISSHRDNAVTESLMSTIKSECVHRQTFENREIAKLEIFDS